MKMIIIYVLLSYVAELSDREQDVEFYIAPVVLQDVPEGCVNIKGERVSEEGLPHKKNFVLRLPSGESMKNEEYKISSPEGSFVGITNNLGETATVCTAIEQEIKVGLNWMTLAD